MHMKSTMVTIVTLFFFSLQVTTSLQAQEYAGPFDQAIRSFLKQDSASFPKKGGVLFVGSSSIGRWNDLEQRLSDYLIIRRGFGGSTYQDISYYAKDIIFPYRPSKIFLYAGENDLVQGKSVKAIMRTITDIHHTIKQKLPFASLYIISVKPSIKLKEYAADIADLNEQIKTYIAKENCLVHFVDIYHTMLDEQREMKPGIFVSDNLHLSGAGYDIWEHVIRGFL